MKYFRNVLQQQSRGKSSLCFLQTLTRLLSKSGIGGEDFRRVGLLWPSDTVTAGTAFIVCFPSSYTISKLANVQLLSIVSCSVWIKVVILGQTQLKTCCSSLCQVKAFTGLL